MAARFIHKPNRVTRRERATIQLRHPLRHMLAHGLLGVIVGGAIGLPHAVRVGTYSLNGAPAYATFHEFNAAVFDSRLPAAPVSSGGAVTVTAVENTAPFPRFVSGTFRFTGTDPARGTQKTVSGTFENASF